MKIKEICVDERPREKMLAKGADAMSNAELLAILIGSGTQKENVLEVANRLLAEGKGKLSMIADMDARRMKEIGGIGSVRYAAIAAAFELGKRCCLEDPGIEKVPLTDAEIVYRMMLPRLRGYQKEIESEDGIAWRIAKDLEGHVPVVYGAPDMEAIAVRMKNQLNENSKIIAFSGVVPEFNHNEVVGWYDDPYRTKFMPVVICDDTLVEISKILKATLDLLESRDVPVCVIDTKGESLLERMIYGIMVGDHISLYIAALHGIDPCNVDPIVDIKTRMKTVLNR